MEGQESACECFFQRDKAYFSGVAFFDELVEEIAPAWPWDMPLLVGEDIEDQKSKFDEKALRTLLALGCIWQEEKLCEKKSSPQIIE